MLQRLAGKEGRRGGEWKLECRGGQGTESSGEGKGKEWGGGEEMRSEGEAGRQRLG